MQIRWEILPLVLMSVIVMTGILRYDRADQPPPLAREFYRPHWEWERTNPIGRRLRVAKRWIGFALAASVALVLLLAFLGINMPVG